MKYLLSILFVLVLACGACEPVDRDDLSARETPGVSDTEIRLGSSLALSGHAGYLGTQTLRGAMSYIRYVNESGGVHGRTIRVVARDDAYDPPTCLANTQQFILGGRVFALFCYVGTPTTVKILPMVQEARIPLLGMFTGANALREPFNRYVVNIRASYYQETEAAVRHLVQGLGIRDIAVFYQFDAYGFDGLVGTELALKQYGLEPVARGSYIRGTRDVEEGLNKILHSGAEAVVMIGTYDACGEFIHRSVEQDYCPLFYNVSFVGGEELARRVADTGQCVVVVSQVVPPPQTFSTQGGEPDYVTLLKRYYPSEEPSDVGLEGYLNARVMVEGLRKAGRKLTRIGFIRAIESLSDFPLGRSLRASFGPDDHQGLDRVFFARLTGGRMVPFRDWSALTPRHGSDCSGTVTGAGPVSGVGRAGGPATETQPDGGGT